MGLKATQVTTDRFHQFPVPRSIKEKTTIKSFLLSQTDTYRNGKAFYELIKPEIITIKKEIVVQHRKTKMMATGASVREILGLKENSTSRFTLDPSISKDFLIFVQSNSPNRHVSPNTMILYEKAEDEKKEDIKRTTLESGIEGIQLTEGSPTKKIKKEEKIERKEMEIMEDQCTQIAISFDTTGSMSSCIHRVKLVVEETIQRLLTTIPYLEIAILVHGDYCDEGRTYLLKKIDFTSDLNQLCNFIQSVTSTYGGDFPECYEYVMNQACTTLSWKTSQACLKSLIMIGDATPHEANESCNFLRIDWRNEADALRNNSIKIYSVRCLAWNESKPFWQELARRTGGHYLELHQFHAIPDFLIAISMSSASNEPNETLFKFRQELKERDGGLCRNFHQLFEELTGEKNEEDESNSMDLDAVAPGRFQMLNVPNDMSIKAFVQLSGAKFQVGKGFYEFTKPEEISLKKEIVLVDKSTGDMFTGLHARAKAGIPEYVQKKRIKPPSTTQWTMFIQSTSYNRKLIGGTRFLYEVDKV